MNVTLPNGQVIHNVPDGTTKAQLAQKLKANGMDVPDEWMKEVVQNELKNPVTGMRAALDATGSLASSVVAGPVSGLAGIAGAVLPGPEGQGAIWQQSTQQALTHQPSTPGSEKIVNTAAAPFTYLAGKADQAGGAVTDATGSPALGTAANTAIQSLPLIAGKVASTARPSISKYIGNRKQAYDAKASRDVVKAQTIEAGRKEGLVTPPSAVDGSFLTNRLESIGGKAAVGQQAALENQEVFNKIARREAGLGENDPITEKTLDQARVPMEEPYREIAALS